MKILPEYGYPYLIDSVNGPVTPKYSWFYNVEQNDFFLHPLRLLEETIGATVIARINGIKLKIPASWNLLVVDEETKVVDTLPISQCSSTGFKAFLMHPNAHDYFTSAVVLEDLVMKDSCSHAMIPKMNMMLHPVCPIEGGKNDYSYSILLSPQDLGKYMNRLTAMEIIL